MMKKINKEQGYITLEEQLEINRRERNAYQELMHPIWLRKGQALRKIREGLKISRREIAECVGASVSVLARLESGKSIQRRSVVERSYQTALKYIPLHRKEIAGII